MKKKMKQKIKISIAVCLVISILLVLAAVFWVVPQVKYRSAGDITHFRYGFGSPMDEGIAYYSLTSEGGTVLFDYGHNDNSIPGRPFEVDSNVMEELKSVLLSTNIVAWDGYKKSANFFDGYMWGLTVTFEDAELVASGHMKTPFGYDRAHHILASYLENLAKSVPK